MKQHKYILGLLFILTIVLSSCEKDINIPIPEASPVIVVNGVFRVGKPLGVSISKSQPIKDVSRIKTISNAKVQLFEDGNLIEELALSQNGFYIGQKQTQAEKRYSIEVSAPGLTAVTAENQLSVPTIIDEVLLDTVTNKEGFNQTRAIIRFTDNGGTKNWYNLKCYTKARKPDTTDVFEIREVPYSAYNNIVLEDESWSDKQGASFSDDIFNGKKIELSVLLNEWEFLNWNDRSFELSLIVELRSISEAHYKYNIGYFKWEETSGSPFSESVQVPTNIRNGLGLFAGYDYTRKEVSIKK